MFQATDKTSRLVYFVYFFLPDFFEWDVSSLIRRKTLTTAKT